MSTDWSMLPWGSLLQGVVIGAALAGAYLVALTAGVQRLARARHPGRHLLMGAGLRLLLVGMVFLWLVVVAPWEQVMGALIGFALMRMSVLAWLTRRRLNDHQS